MRAWVDERAGEDDVVIVSFKSKMNTIGPGVIDGLAQAIELAEKDYKGVVIWQPTSLKLGTPGGPFSAGANLEEAMPAFMMGGAKGIEPFVKKFQDRHAAREVRERAGGGGRARASPWAAAAS